MTKEELLIKHCGYPSITEVNGVRVTSNVENAMDEYAKQQAIALARYINLKLELHGDNYVYKYGNGEVFTPDEIYVKLIEQQHKHNDR